MLRLIWICATGYYTLTEVKENSQKLKKKFDELIDETLQLFEKGHISVQTVVYKLTGLKVGEDSENDLFFGRNLKDLEGCNKFMELFSRLNRHWHYLSPQLLYHLIEKFYSQTDVQKDKEVYDEQLREFLKRTLLEHFCNIDEQYKEPPDGFSEIVAKFNENHTPRDLTLQLVDDFRNKYTRTYRLRDFSLMLFSRIKENSYLISFMVPHSVIQVLTKPSYFSQQICKDFGVTKILFGDNCIYCEASESVYHLLKMCPRRQSPFELPDSLSTAVIHQSTETTSCGTNTLLSLMLNFK